MSDAPPADVRISLALTDDWPVSGDGDIGLVVAQIPEASSLPRGTRVLVDEEAPAGKPGVLGRVLGRRARRASRAARASALLARGYERIQCSREDSSGPVWGYA